MRFLQLRPGAYALRETQPTAFADGLDTAGSAGGAARQRRHLGDPVPEGRPDRRRRLQLRRDDDRRPRDREVRHARSGAAGRHAHLHRDGAQPRAERRDERASGAIRCPPAPCSARWPPPRDGRARHRPPVPAATSPAAAPTLPNGAVATFTVDPAGGAGCRRWRGPHQRDRGPIGHCQSDAANNTDVEPTVVAGATSADLAIVKTDAADPVLTGANVTYTLTVTNNGPATATGVTVDRYGSGGAGLRVGHGQPGHVHRDHLRSRHAGARRPGHGDGGGGQHGARRRRQHRHRLGHRARFRTWRTTPTPSPRPSPTPPTPTWGDQGDRPDPVVAGGLVSYQLVIENRGPAIAMLGRVVDELPPGVEFEQLIPPNVPAGAICTTPPVGSTGTIVCNAPSIPVGARYVIDVRVRVAAGTPGRPSPTESSWPPPRRTHSANNLAAVPTLVVLRLGRRRIVKTDAPNPQAAGAAVSYGFAVTNNGPSVATNVTVTDTPAAGTAFVSGSAGCSATARSSPAPSARSRPAPAPRSASSSARRRSRG